MYLNTSKYDAMMSYGSTKYVLCPRNKPPQSQVSAAPSDDVVVGDWWKEFLSGEEGNSWFDSWNHVVQAKFDVLASIAEEREHTETEPYRVLMVGDSTMGHQFGAVCGFMGERGGRRYDPEVRASQKKNGCCMDTLSEEEGGGRGLCFEYDKFRFVDPKRPEETTVDAYYFGSGLHLLHMYPHWPELNPMEPLRIQSWLNYENLLEGVVQAVRTKNGPDVKVAFMTNHVIADQLFAGEYKEIRDAYRVGEGNATIRAECQGENNVQVRQAAVGNPGDFDYNDWHGYPNITEFITTHEGEGLFTVGTYCEEAMLDRRGSLQLSRRARPVMSRLEVPIVDAARIVEGQAWASKIHDGRHYHKIVPMEVAELLSVLGAPPPPAALPDRELLPVATAPDDPGLRVIEKSELDP
ncbi:unnamed protein product [Pylaiella littoralis]